MQKKPCNKCGKPFQPKGPYNRTCVECARENAHISKRGGQPGNAEPLEDDSFRIESFRDGPVGRFVMPI
jgi:hypothetical protein